MPPPWTIRSTPWAWLANEIPNQSRALRQGERITTEVYTDIYLANPGDTIRADFGVFGSVEVGLV